MGIIEFDNPFRAVYDGMLLQTGGIRPARAGKSAWYPATASPVARVPVSLQYTALLRALRARLKSVPVPLHIFSMRPLPH